MLKSRMNRVYRPITAAMLVLLVGSGLIGSPLLAQPEGIKGFTPLGDYVLEIDGVDQEGARIFGAREARAIVVLSDDLPAPLLISLGTGAVSGLQLMKVAQQANGSVDLLPNPVAENYGNYSVDGEKVVFQIGELAAAVKPKPVLVGNRTAEDLVSHDLTYGTKRDLYSPSAELLDRLRQEGGAVRVRVYFGTWCPFCAEMVPRVLKVAEELEGSNIVFEYYGLPRSIGEDPEARAMSIGGVPTGIVYRDGKELGRINGNGWRSPEQAILDLL